MSEPGGPLLMRSGLTETVYVVSAYKDLGDGHYEAIRKYDVTDQFDALVAADRDPEKILVPRELLESLVYRDSCSFDHHGGCQAHGYLSLEPGEMCPHEQAKRLLADATSGADHER